MQRLMINLTKEEVRALYAIAENERREIKQQAAYLLRQALEQLGLLQPVTPGNNQQGEVQHEPT